VELAEGGFFFRAMRVAVDYGPAHAADAFTAVMVKGDGFFTFPG
jgi:hypothetical protein